MRSQMDSIEQMITKMNLPQGAVSGIGTSFRDYLKGFPEFNPGSLSGAEQVGKYKGDGTSTQTIALTGLPTTCTVTMVSRPPSITGNENPLDILVAPFDYSLVPGGVSVSGSANRDGYIYQYSAR